MFKKYSDFNGLTESSSLNIINVPNLGQGKGRIALLGFPGLLIGSDSHTFLDPKLQEELFMVLFKNGCRIFYSFASENDLPKDTISISHNIALKQGINFRTMPIKDFGIPSSTTEKEWCHHTDELMKALQNNQLIGLSCLSGIGRSGMMAADLLSKVTNMTPFQAIAWVRDILPVAIENQLQEKWVGTTNIRKDK